MNRRILPININDQIQSNNQPKIMIKRVTPSKISNYDHQNRHRLQNKQKFNVNLENKHMQSSQQKKVIINGKVIETNSWHHNNNNVQNELKERTNNKESNIKKQTRYGHIIVKDYTQESIQQQNNIKDLYFQIRNKPKIFENNHFVSFALNTKKQKQTKGFSPNTKNRLSQERRQKLKIFPEKIQSQKDKQKQAQIQALKRQMKQLKYKIDSISKENQQNKNIQKKLALENVGRNISNKDSIATVNFKNELKDSYDNQRRQRLQNLNLQNKILYQNLCLKLRNLTHESLLQMSRQSQIQNQYTDRNILQFLDFIHQSRVSKGRNKQNSSSKHQRFSSRAKQSKQFLDINQFQKQYLNNERQSEFLSPRRKSKTLKHLNLGKINQSNQIQSIIVNKHLKIDKNYQNKQAIMSPLSFQGNTFKNQNTQAKGYKKNQTYTFNSLKTANQPLTVDQVKNLFKMNNKTQRPKHSDNNQRQINYMLKNDKKVQSNISQQWPSKVRNIERSKTNLCQLNNKIQQKIIRREMQYRNSNNRAL